MAATVLDQPVVSPEPDDDVLYEIFDGQRVEKLMGMQQILLANWLAYFINQVAVTPRLGFAVVEPLLDFGNPGSRQYRPDVAFLSEERWPRNRTRPPTNAWAVVPDLAVEVVSPSNSADEIHAKVADYLKAGVRLVWVIYLNPACIYVFDGSLTIRIVKVGEELDGGAVVPGFRLPLATLFGAEVEPA